MKFKWIRQHDDCWPVTVMCKVLRASRSGYYIWLKRPISEQAIRRKHLTMRIAQVHRHSKMIYGSPRIHRELQAIGEACSENTVAKIMRENSIKSVIKRKHRVATTDSGHGYGIADNHLNREFEVVTANHRWACDITYIRTGQDWLYLAVVLDLYSRRVVGYAMADHLQASLAIDALTMALVKRRPKSGGWRNQELLHHSDRGVQYACGAYRAMLEAHGLTASMSRRGNCWDNAPMESYFGSLKTEWVDHRWYATHREARRSIEEYINWYNTERRHSSLGYVSPQAYEESAA